MVTNMRIIGISGKKGSGKNTVAEIIKAYRNESSVIYAFADPLKKEVSMATGCTVEFIEKNKTIFRPILQWWGTEFRRKFYGDNYWIDQMTKVKDIYNSTYSLLIIPDMRFKNEMKWVIDNGGITVRVERDNLDYKDTHASEIDLDNEIHDVNIHNFGDISNLHYHVKNLLETMEIHYK